MFILIITVCLIMAIIIFLMFLVLKHVVKVVNNQAESYFTNELQAYDNLILNREDKDTKPKELKVDKQESNNTKEELNKESGYDTGVVDLFNQDKYHDNSVLALNKKIDEEFSINYEELIKDFVSLTKEKDNYDFCLNLRNKFTSDVIYEIKTKTDIEKEEYYKKILTKEEYKIYEAFLVIINNNSIENFVSYLDQLVDLNNPKIVILVGNKKENYNYLSKYIETIYSAKIYKGIKIIYHNKMYDFSLCERN